MIPFFVTPTTLQQIEFLAAEVLAYSVISLKNPKDVLADAAKEAYLAVNPNADFGDSNTNANFGAFRHAYISAKIAQYYGTDVAKVMGDTGETFNPRNNNINPDGSLGQDAQRVDDYNNDIGNSIGTSRAGVNGLLGVDIGLAQMLSDKVNNNELATKVSEVPATYEHAPSLIGSDLVQDIIQSVDDVYPNLKKFFDDLGWVFDNPIPVLGDLGKLLPSWLMPVSGLYGQAPLQVSSPLVLDLDGDGVEASKMGYGTGASTVYFDMDNDGFAERTAWATGGDGLLALDKNGNGKIDNQNELFGNNATYANGFLNLKQYDSNSDNKITSADADGYYLTQSPQRHTEFTENSVSNDNHKNGGVIVRRMDAMRLAG